MDLSEFHDIFFEETTEGLQTLESTLLSLDAEAADAEAINTIFRAAHSIKGGAATFGFTALADFTHVMETLLDEVRAGKRTLCQDLVDLFLASVDCLKDMVQTLQAGGELDPEQSAPLKQKLEAALGSTAGATSVKAKVTAGQAEGENIGPATTWLIRFRPHAHLLATGHDPVRLFRSLGELGELSVRADTSKLPPLKEMDPESCYMSWEVELKGDVSREAIEEIFEWVEGDCDLEILPHPPVAARMEQADVAGDGKQPDANDTTESKAPATPPAAAERPSSGERRTAADRGAATAESSSIRVSIDKIDTLINMLGELVITQSMLSQLGEEVHNFDAAWVKRLRDGLSQLEHNTRELQEAVMRVRMVPISFAFQRFPRMVRDISRKLGKKVELKLSGEQTELDKTVMEKIGDPLVHLVRNSLDHGLEPPEVRRAAGKPEIGIIHLNAYHQGGNIVIKISDDGAGLKREKILAKARERGLVGKDEELEDAAVFDLIFQPGFSTADTVSDLSGRGVGMDVVRRNIQALGGDIEVESEPGKGCTFTIRLPLTLAIIDGQLVRIGGEIFIIPLTAIIELLQMDDALLNVISNETEVYRLREKHIPVIHPHRLFGLTPTEMGRRLLVVVEGGGETVGLVVEEMLGQQQVVVKSLESNFKRMQGIAGATVLGDGTVALIIDIDGLIRMARQDARRPRLAVLTGGRAVA